MAANIAKMHAALKKKKAEEKERHESRVEAGRASIQRRWTAPVAPARQPLGNVDSNRRQSEPPPPPPLASAAAVKESERKQTGVLNVRGWARRRSTAC